MLILEAEQVRAWDDYTIVHEPIRSIDLMERAAFASFNWLIKNGYDGCSFRIYCGKGNNGGDGLAIARLLLENGNAVSVHILEFGHKGTPDFQSNLARLHEITREIYFIPSEENIRPPEKPEIIIDALFGTGLNRPLEGLSACLVQHINDSGNPVISIDVPSGLYTDRSSKDTVCIHATHTLSFQCYKPGLLMEENAEKIGRVHILDIGLHPEYVSRVQPVYRLIDHESAHPLLKTRNPFAHKGNFGHAALVTGSYGMMGASVMAAKACLRSGVGKLTVHIPACGYNILQLAVPGAMTHVEKGEKLLESISPMERYSAVGIGPGLGLADSTADWLGAFFRECKQPLAVDADALNLISKNRHLLPLLPPQTILTPHGKEFERIFGKLYSDFERIELAKKAAAETRCILVLKGHHTLVISPDGQIWFNSSGNAGMATGGTGDVLLGIITGLLAQGYPALDAACLGVYLHGRAGDYAAAYYSEEALIATDITEFLGNAFRELHGV